MIGKIGVQKWSDRKNPKIGRLRDFSNNLLNPGNLVEGQWAIGGGGKFESLKSALLIGDDREKGFELHLMFVGLLKLNDRRVEFVCLAGVDDDAAKNQHGKPEDRDEKHPAIASEHTS